MGKLLSPQATSWIRDPSAWPSRIIWEESWGSPGGSVAKTSTPQSCKWPREKDLHPVPDREWEEPSCVGFGRLPLIGRCPDKLGWQRAASLHQPKRMRVVVKHTRKVPHLARLVRRSQNPKLKLQGRDSSQEFILMVIWGGEKTLWNRCNWKAKHHSRIVSFPGHLPVFTTVAQLVVQSRDSWREKGNSGREWDLDLEGWKQEEGMAELRMRSSIPNFPVIPKNTVLPELQMRQYEDVHI